MVTVTGHIWSTGRAAVTALTVSSGAAGFTNTISESGFDNRTPSHAGSLVLVTPFRVAISAAGNIGGFATLSLTFVPEPGSFAMEAFTPRVVDELRPRVETLVEERLDSAARADGFDWVRDLADPVPTIVIATLLGVPARDHETLRRWSRELLILVDPVTNRIHPRRFERTILALRDYFSQLFEARRLEPRDDLVSRLVAVEEQGDLLNERGLFALCVLILIAGYETTTNLLGNAVLLLSRHPGERERLRGEPDLLQTAIEEFLRLESPLQITARACIRPCNLAGQRIETGDLSGPGPDGCGAAREPPSRLRARPTLLPRCPARASRGPGGSRSTAAPLSGLQTGD